MNTPKSWNREEIIETMRLYSPNQALTRKDYAAFSETHEGLVPSEVTILTHFNNWNDFRLSTWGAGGTTWHNQEHCISAMRAKCPEAMNLDQYRRFSKGDTTLPSESVLYDYFKTWNDVTFAVWGVTKAWTRNRMEQVLTQHFETAPTVRKLNALAEQDPNIPTAHYCRRVFGSYPKMKEVVFKPKPATPERFDESTLIQLMTERFPIPPKSFKLYEELTQLSPTLPTGEAYLRQFGSWGQAMLACYPERVGFKKGKRWTEDRALAALRLAYEELGEALTIKTYQEWASKREDAPSAHTVILCWGKFSIARKMAQTYPIPVSS